MNRKTATPEKLTGDRPFAPGVVPDYPGGSTRLPRGKLTICLNRKPAPSIPVDAEKTPDASVGELRRIDLFEEQCVRVEVEFQPPVDARRTQAKYGVEQGREGGTGGVRRTRYA